MTTKERLHHAVETMTEAEAAAAVRTLAEASGDPVRWDQSVSSSSCAVASHVGCGFVERVVVAADAPGEEATAQMGPPSRPRSSRGAGQPAAR